MNKAVTIPRQLTVKDGVLTQQDQGAFQRILVDSPQWFEWLCAATHFHLVSADDNYSVSIRKERSSSGKCYWKAYRRCNGKLLRVYLGKSENITNARLHQALATLCYHRQNAVTAPRVAPVPATPWAKCLETKLHMPFICPHFFLPRPRLIQLMDEYSQLPVILVSAPAGFGKTTLLCEWCRHVTTPVAWLTLDAADGDPMRFWTAVFMALETVYPGLITDALHILTTSEAFSFETVQAMLIHSLMGCKEDIYLILDDYHRMWCDTIQQQVATVIKHLPPKFHIILSCRADPQLPLVRMHITGFLAELRADALSFTQSECEAFFAMHTPCTLSAIDIAAVHTYSEGWVAGLQLVALAMGQSTPITEILNTFNNGSHRSLNDYLTEAVFLQLPASLQEFLLKTSILDQFNSSLCKAVTNQEDSQQLLETVEHNNLFLIGLDATRCWFRYHHLFGDFLLNRLQQNFANLVPVLHQRASAWYETVGVIERAVHHALAAHDSELAIRLIEQCADACIQRGEIRTIQAWRPLIPEAAIQQHPALCGIFARVLMMSGDHVQAAYYVQHAEKILAERSDMHHQQRLIAELADIRGVIAAFHSDFTQAITLYKRALHCLPADCTFHRTKIAINMGTAYMALGDIPQSLQAYEMSESISISSGNYAAALESLYNIGSISMLQGQLPKAAATFKQALQIANEAHKGELPITSLSTIGLGMVLYEWNKLAEAKQYVTDGLRLNTRFDNNRAMLYGTVILAQIAHAEHQQDDMQAHLSHLYHQLQRSTLSPRERAHIVLYCIRLNLLADDIANALHWMQQSGVTTQDVPRYTNEQALITLAHLLIRQQQPAEAHHLLDHVQRSVEAGNRLHRKIEILIFRSLAFLSQGETEAAMNALTQALRQAEPGGYIRLFIDTSAQLMPLMTKMRKMLLGRRSIQVSLPYLGAILSAFTAEQGFVTSAYPDALSQLFSEREQEIIKLMIHGHSTPAIAQRLILEQSTIKWHIKNVYTKLNVHNRMQMIAQVKGLSILEMS